MRRDGDGERRPRGACASLYPLVLLRSVLTRARPAQAAGVIDAAALFAAEAELAEDACGAALVHGELVIEPWLAALAIARDGVKHGVEVRTAFRVSEAERRGASGWTVSSDAGDSVEARVVVNAAGNGAEAVERLGTGESTFTCTPARGQYLVLSGGDVSDRLSHALRAVPGPGGNRGAYVYPTVYGQVVVGPTNEQWPTDDAATANPTVDPVRACRSRSKGWLVALTFRFALSLSRR